MSSVLPVVVASGSATTVLAAFAGAIARTFIKSLKQHAEQVVKLEINQLALTVKDHLARVEASAATAAAKSSSLEVALAKEFGGNSNGIRQAINELTKDVAALKGAFAQLTKEAPHG